MDGGWLVHVGPMVCEDGQKVGESSTDFFPKFHRVSQSDGWLVRLRLVGFSFLLRFSDD